MENDKIQESKKNLQTQERPEIYKIHKAPPQNHISHQVRYVAFSLVCPRWHWLSQMFAYISPGNVSNIINFFSEFS